MVALTTLVTIVAAAFAPLASADHHIQGAGHYVNAAWCPGGVIQTGDLGPCGKWEVYFAAKNGGTYCLFVKNKLGKSRYMSAKIMDVGKPGAHYGVDSGDFSKWAGSLRLNNMLSSCVRIEAACGAQAPASWSDCISI